MIILHAYSPAFKEPSASPFVVKVMCLLEMSGFAWKPKFSTDPRKAPKAKFPVIIDGDQIVPDSSQIADHLIAKGAVFNAGLSDVEVACGHALTRMVEEHLYFTIVQDRWARDENWPIISQKYFGHMPWVLRQFVPSLARKQALGSLNGQGIGRHSFEEATARAAKDIDAIAVHLGDQPFLFGDSPKQADASVGAMLGGISDGPTDTPLRRLVRDHATLPGYLDRLHKTIYPSVERLAA
ncbi:MAG: glutathione S-transferase family protein [Pikeienuella sp.]